MERELENRIENEIIAKGVNPLYFCLSGSRGVGINTEDADYDIRFLYKRPICDYHKIKTPKDVINFTFTNKKLFDVSGWDIHKAIKLFYNENYTLIEWLSVMQFRNYLSTDLIEQLFELYKQDYNPNRHIRHFVGRGISSMLRGKLHNGIICYLACKYIENHEIIYYFDYDALFKSAYDNVDHCILNEINNCIGKRANGEPFQYSHFLHNSLWRELKNYKNLKIEKVAKNVKDYDELLQMALGV